MVEYLLFEMSSKHRRTGFCSHGNYSVRNVSWGYINVQATTVAKRERIGIIVHPFILSGLLCRGLVGYIAHNSSQNALFLPVLDFTFSRVPKILP